ncbi:LacI family DNA-binding transcriptional regulator [Gramella sp. MAR_2010_147]|uniref:LacI family DNA-binding transcriptional regulator n=1 Tax=Gramella sp. MAR_2010_147 TaxID=1250205 RepID=UPI00087A2407|nr:LacI family DNA-binding transcriptional regulator [Gramella sp. MAR_2010_147]SDS06029.1 transcriptional regulator, LacI family [Gramella sp. MAR_2010_147]
MKKKRKISIKDISEELGISTTTISFIINNKAENRISKKVIKRVEDYIQEVGYIPNSSAQTLRTGKTKTIVFMAEDISDPFFSAIAKEMEGIAFENGYKIIYCSTENNKERAIELLNLFKERQVDAFIITPPEGFREELEVLINERKQVVMVFDRYYDDLDHNYVVLDNIEGSKQATSYLFETGFNNVGFIGLKSDISPTLERLEGYRQGVKAKGKNEFSVLIPFDKVKTGTGKEMIREFLKKNPQIDSLLFATNSLAISGLKVLKEESLNIPKDVSVITFDDRDLFELYSPSISVVSQPVSKLADELIKGTLNLLKSEYKETVKFQKVLKGHLIKRDSSQLTPEDSSI